MKILKTGTMKVQDSTFWVGRQLKCIGCNTELELTEEDREKIVLAPSGMSAGTHVDCPTCGKVILRMLYSPDHPYSKLAPTGVDAKANKRRAAMYREILRAAGANVDDDQYDMTLWAREAMKRSQAYERLCGWVKKVHQWDLKYPKGRVYNDTESKEVEDALSALIEEAKGIVKP